MAMTFEMVPFFWGASWYVVRRGNTSGAALAVLADASGAAAGWIFARVAATYAQRD